MPEHALTGGNVAAEVVRVGGTVRKPAGFWTPGVEALLAHLEAAGFTGAPRPLGRDDRGRRVLEYVPASAAYIDRHLATWRRARRGMKSLAGGWSFGGPAGGKQR